MASYMAEVAKMLGVEFGEEFYIKEMPNIKCKIYKDGLYIYHVRDCACSLPRSGEILNSLLTGEVIVEHKPWKPKETEYFYSITPEGGISGEWWTDRVWNHSNLYKLGNCYRTKEEVEANRDKWAAFYASDEVMEV